MNWRRIATAVLFTIPVLALLAFGMTRDPRELPSTMPGKPAPEFSLTKLNAEDAPATLAGHRGEVVILNFWASWCLACRDEHRALSNVAERYEGQPVQFYGVLYNDTPKNGSQWIQAMGGQSYPALLDPGARTAIDYGLYGVPETFIIGPDGRIAYKHVGPVTEALLEEWIQRLTPAAEGTS